MKNPFVWQTTIVGAIAGSILAGTSAIADDIVHRGDVKIGRSLGANGFIGSDSGFLFPDGTLQVTASASAQAVGSLSVNLGIYHNKIADITQSEGFVEICFKNSSFEFDSHPFGGSSIGGNCDPGDVGWIIETEERGNGSWTLAKASCLMSGRRLPEPFEFQFTCLNAGILGVEEMTDGLGEWASNQSFVGFVGAASGAVTVVMGDNSCDFGSISAIARNIVPTDSNEYRCAL